MTFRADIKAQVLSALTGSPPVAARVYWLRAPLKVETPYVVLSILSETRDPTLQGNIAQARIRLRIDFFGENYTELQDLDAEVRAVMAAASVFVSLHAFASELYEDDTRLYHLVSEFSIFHPNP